MQICKRFKRINEIYNEGAIKYMSETLHKRKPPYVMLVILFIGAFVSFLNNSLLNVALPSIMKDLNIQDYSTIQWLSTGYMLVSGILIPASAFLITRFSNRSLFITSMVIFILGTALAAVAPNFGLLLTGRMVQAAGSSVMGPLLMNIMLVSFPREKGEPQWGFWTSYDYSSSNWADTIRLYCRVL